MQGSECRHKTVRASGQIGSSIITQEESYWVRVWLFFIVYTTSGFFTLLNLSFSRSIYDVQVAQHPVFYYCIICLPRGNYLSIPTPLSMPHIWKMQCWSLLQCWVVLTFHNVHLCIIIQCAVGIIFSRNWKATSPLKSHHITLNYSVFISNLRTLADFQARLFCKLFHFHNILLRTSLQHLFCTSLL